MTVVASTVVASTERRLRVALLTREYPPEVYGGAGVHVTYLARELSGLVDLTVHCQGADRAGAVAHRPWELLDGANQALQTISTDLSMTAAVGSADLVHSHTWYANLAGHLAALLYGVPHIVTAHSLEPLRPWKAEQLGGGYALSSWCEKVAVESAAAVIAVSEGMRADVLAAYPAVPPERVRVIRNGIDTIEYAADPGTDVLQRYGVEPARPTVVFVCRLDAARAAEQRREAAGVAAPEDRHQRAAARGERPRPGGPARDLRGPAGHPGASRRGDRAGRAPAGDQVRRGLAVRHARQARGHPVAVARHGVCLPVTVRTVGDREPTASTRSWATRIVPPGWASKGVSGRSPNSAGPPSRPRRRPCTPSWPAKSGWPSRGPSSTGRKTNGYA